MTLDLLKVSNQVARLSQAVAQRAGWLGRRRALARELLAANADNWQSLRGRLPADGQRIAVPTENLTARRSAPELPPDYEVIATDGSQIEPDRHGLAEYFLINVGWAAIRYGSAPDAHLDSDPRLVFEPDELVVREGERRVPIRGGHLAARRAVAELERAADLAAARAPGGPPLAALQDGTLLLWVLEDRPADFLRNYFLRPYVDQLARFQEIGVPIASYVSRPRSTEVTALLRAADCRGIVAECARCRDWSPGGCPLDGLADRDLFADLAPGERSARFAVALNPQLAGYYAGHEIHFTYVNVGSEIARLEFPRWVAASDDLLDLVHAIVVRQCELGQGYPVALARAHEQAVVTGADRATFEALLEAALVAVGLDPQPSEKLLAKRIQAV